VNGTGVTKVAFKLDSTALNTDTVMSDGMQCQIDTTKFANGTHTLTATATSSTGATRSDVISINIQNSGSRYADAHPDANPDADADTRRRRRHHPYDPAASTSAMPTDSSGVRGVATFQSIGLYWTSPGAARPAARCSSASRATAPGATASTCGSTRVTRVPRLDR
jgi:hypothetical protein